MKLAHVETLRYILTDSKLFTFLALSASTQAGLQTFLKLEQHPVCAAALFSQPRMPRSYVTRWAGCTLPTGAWWFWARPHAEWFSDFPLPCEKRNLTRWTPKPNRNNSGSPFSGSPNEATNAEGLEGPERRAWCLRDAFLGALLRGEPADSLAAGRWRCFFLRNACVDLKEQVFSIYQQGILQWTWTGLNELNERTTWMVRFTTCLVACDLWPEIGEHLWPSMTWGSASMWPSLLHTGESCWNATLVARWSELEMRAKESVWGILVFETSRHPHDLMHMQAAFWVGGYEFFNSRHQLSLTNQKCQRRLQQTFLQFRRFDWATVPKNL